jgi:[NiFe] hydrogenase diaphorase moiety large subunit
MTEPDSREGGSASKEISALVGGIIGGVGGDRTRLLDIVQAVQARLGHVPDTAIRAIAAGLGIHAVEIADMASFYAFVNRAPGARFNIRLSRSPVSLMQGAPAVAEAFAAATGAAIGSISADREFALDWTSDIGMADQEPAALINGTVLTRLAADDVAEIVAALRRLPAAGALPPAGNLAAVLPKARIDSGLVTAGPVLFHGDARAGTGLRAALARAPDEIIREITRSKLRGRGGAGFPTGLKWKLCRQSIGPAHHVICNADEGEPGTFKDRVLLREIPDLMLDGMTIAAYAIGARAGLVYLRGEYAWLWGPLQAVLEERRRLGLLGRNVGGCPGFDFDIRIQLGAGAYVCGEESALIESLEGKRGVPRDRPPFPTDRGYRQEPTAVDNVETFACAARIMERGADWFAGFGTRESTGTKLLSVSGDCPRPGVHEVPFGITVNALLDLVGAPDAGLVQIGGPSGQAIGAKDFGRQIAYEDLSTGGSVMVFGPQRDVLDIVGQFAGFFATESCGWCTPCRVGTTLLREGVDRIRDGRATLADITALEALAGTVRRMSRCGLGQTAPNPILSTMRNFPEAYEARLRPEPFLPRVSLRTALAEAVAVQGREPAPEGELA